jgi:lysophospholipase L1-like esterase
MYGPLLAILSIICYVIYLHVKVDNKVLKYDSEFIIFDDLDSELGDDLESDSKPQLNKDGTINILLLGDSITKGVPHTYRGYLHDLLMKNGTDFKFIGSKNGPPDVDWDNSHEAHNGWTTQKILNEVSFNYVDIPDIALIHLGSNDTGGSTNHTVPNMLRIIQKLREQNEYIHIYVAKILPIGLNEHCHFGSSGLSTCVNRNNTTNELNNSIENELALQSTLVSPIKIVDMNTGFNGASLTDGIHPTASTANEMAERWFSNLILN